MYALQNKRTAIFFVFYWINVRIKIFCWIDYRKPFVRQINHQAHYEQRWWACTAISYKCYTFDEPCAVGIDNLAFFYFAPSLSQMMSVVYVCVSFMICSIRLIQPICASHRTRIRGEIAICHFRSHFPGKFHLIRRPLQCSSNGCDAYATHN